MNSAVKWTQHQIGRYFERICQIEFDDPWVAIDGLSSVETMISTRSSFWPKYCCFWYFEILYWYFQSFGRQITSRFTICGVQQNIREFELTKSFTDFGKLLDERLVLKFLGWWVTGDFLMKNSRKDLRLNASWMIKNQKSPHCLSVLSLSSSH